MEIFKLCPIGKDYLWGGTTLKKEYGKDINLTPLAETWECSVHKDGPSIIINGKFAGMELVEVLKMYPEYLGLKNNNEMPLLFKLIDAKKNLSIQVHPDDEYAMTYEGQYGKSEMWYILKANEGASILYGFKQKVTENKLRQSLEEGSLVEILNRVHVKKGDIVYIPAGTIHSLGAGITVAEIQQNSNLTYRVYDYDRIDKNGNKRELHLEKAIKVMNMDKINIPILNFEVNDDKCHKSDSKIICNCNCFITDKIKVNDEYSIYVNEESFQILFCIEGNGRIAAKDNKDICVNFRKGDCMFIPANIGACNLYGDMELLKVRC